jgi:hypothetical protein
MQDLLKALAHFISIYLTITLHRPYRAIIRRFKCLPKYSNELDRAPIPAFAVSLFLFPLGSQRRLNFQMNQVSVEKGTRLLRFPRLSAA